MTERLGSLRSSGVPLSNKVPIVLRYVPQVSTARTTRVPCTREIEPRQAQSGVFDKRGLKKTNIRFAGSLIGGTYAAAPEKWHCFFTEGNGARGEIVHPCPTHRLHRSRGLITDRADGREFHRPHEKCLMGLAAPRVAAIAFQWGVRFNGKAPTRGATFSQAVFGGDRDIDRPDTFFGNPWSKFAKKCVAGRAGGAGKHRTRKRGLLPVATSDVTQAALGRFGLDVLPLST
jgi:hypothetical protein